MVGGKVNKTKVKEREEQEANAEPVTVTEAEENLCTAASGDICGAGISGTGDGQFKFPTAINVNELDSSGAIFIGDENRILEFGEDGIYQGDIPLPGAGLTEALAVAPDHSLYAISQNITEKISNGKELVDTTVVREIGPGGEEIRRLKGQWEGRVIPLNPQALAVDTEENVYVAGTVIYEVPSPKEGEPPLFEPVEEIITFEAGGDLISFETDKAGFGAPTDDSELFNLATNVVEGTIEPGEVLVAHFFNGSGFGKPSLSYVRSYGRPFALKQGPPVVEDQYTTSVASSEATVEGLINPKFTTDTIYQVEYGANPCEPGTCESVAPVAPAQLGGSANTGIATGPVTLSGLQPATTYYFRFRAENEVTDEEESGPVYGEEGTFRTFAASVPPEPCPNDFLRLGPAKELPDCRAYEMVSPLDKEGGRIQALRNVVGYPATLEQGAAAGDGLTYSSYRAFADPDSSPYTSQYLTRRTSSGWSSEPISPPREGISKPNLDSQYKLFSEDLSEAWLVTDSEPPLAEGAIEGQRNLYQRENGTGAYEVQCPVAPLEAPTEQFLVEPQGASTDGSHVALWANARLLEEAAPIKASQLYECVNGTELRLVSVLPGGEASPSGGSAGTDDGGILGFGYRENNVAGAVSTDGSRIFWTAGSGPGPLYVRINGTETVQIAASGARFRAASPDGTRALYTTAAGIFEASVEEGAATSTQIAGEVRGFMGTSEDTQLVYFVSREDLDGGGEAEAGDPNLYLYRAIPDTYTFIGALAENDAREVAVPNEECCPVLTPVARAPYNRSARVSPDGLHAAFTSSAPLTGYDNTDQASGEADAEVFLYDAEAEELTCVSCNPSGARPKGVNASTKDTPFWAAAKIPGWENQFHASRVLSEDGDRLFFEAIDPLALGDTNGVQDVYQWEAPGTGTCTEASPSFSPTNGGCIELISTGKSKEPSEIVDASADGSDVFFKTYQSLWPEDPGALDIYDARVGGGFVPPPPPEECEGEACQPTSPAPQAKTPSSSGYLGPGNAVAEPAPKPKKCRKGTHKVRKGGKVRCVKNKAKGSKAGKSRGARR